jgi:hypothetical protein
MPEPWLLVVANSNDDDVGVEDAEIESVVSPTIEKRFAYRSGTAG